MKKNDLKFMSIAMTMALVAGCAAPQNVEPVQTTAVAETTETTAADQTEVEEVIAEDALPQIGEESSGFVVRELVPMKSLGATGVLYEHEKSGAQLLYLASEDTNRSFDISFRTPALDDKGKPHVFEHITICGSQKYPDANMFFPFYNRTYNTFVNAATFHGMTCYPVASLSEEQLMSMMDYYLSGVFEPLLYTEPKLAQREAWRYELSDADADLNIAGTVYSEMQGVLTLSEVARNNDVKTLFEGSTTAHISGGVPESIRTLTYEELTAFHDTYYHPSNALITLYGKLDIDQFLKVIDRDYLSAYDRKEIQVDTGKIEPFTETKYAEYEFPVEQGTDTENASEIYYSFALNGADLLDALKMDILSAAVTQESSPMMQALREKLPDAEISYIMSFDSPSCPHLSLLASGVNPEDRDLFVSSVDEGLSKIVTDGISADALDSVLAASKLSLLTTQEDTDLGVDASMMIALGWTYYDTVNFYPLMEEAVETITQEGTNALIQKYLTGNHHRAVSVTKPAAGLAEQEAEAFAKELDDKKKAMTKEEVDTMVQSSEAFLEWAGTPASDEIISQIGNMKVEDLPEEWRHYDVTDEMKDDVRWMTTTVDASDVVTGRIFLDGSTVPIEKMQDVQLALKLMGELDTKAHSKEELSTLITRYLPDFTSELTAYSGSNEAGYYGARFRWMGMTEDAKPSMELLSELMFETDYTDTSLIKSLMNRWNSSFTSNLDDNRLEIQLTRCNAMGNVFSAYKEHVNNYDWFMYLKEMIALADSDPAALTKRLDEARNYVLNKNGAKVLMAGSQDAIDSYGTQIQGIFDQMTGEERDTVDYSELLISKKNEGIVTNSTVQMNILSQKYDNYSGKDEVISSLINDVYMLPKLRNALGAYDAYSGMSCISNYLYTYRDPNLESSYQIFEELPGYLRDTELTQEDVDNYIRGSYSRLSRPQGLLAGGLQAISDLLVGCSEELHKKWMKEAKETTAEDVKANAKLFDQLLQDGVRSSSSTESALKAAKGLFDVLIYPDGTVMEVK